MTSILRGPKAPKLTPAPDRLEEQKAAEEAAASEARNKQGVRKSLLSGEIGDTSTPVTARTTAKLGGGA